MAPFAFTTVYSFLALVVLPQALAGPGCAYRNRGKPDCVEKCKNHWGYGGNCMGHDMWGSVISSSKDQCTDPDSVLSVACGLDKTTASDPVSIPTDPSPSSPSESPPLATRSIPTSSESHSDPTPSSSSTSSSTSSIRTVTPTTTPFTTSTPISPPPSSSPSPSPPSDVAERPSPTPLSDKPSTPPAEPSPTPNASDGDDFRATALDKHNSFRALHGASPLTWNETLATAAKSWVSQCKFQHSGGTLGPFGENLAAGTGGYSVADGIKGWTDEVSDYIPENPTYSHFTQVVWKGTEQLGCASFTCDSLAEVPWKDPATFIACEYYPPGNVIGQSGENVQV